MACAYAESMRITGSLLARAAFAIAAAVTVAGVSPAQMHRRDQDAAFEAMREGRIMPLRSIESRVLPRYPGAVYMGPEYDAPTQRYRMKFMRGGRVIWVDVDARSGRIVDQTGN